MGVGVGVECVRRRERPNINSDVMTLNKNINNEAKFRKKEI